MLHDPEKIDEILPLIPSQSKSAARYYADVLSNNIDLDEFIKQTKNDNGKFYFSFFYAAMGEQTKADSIITSIDGSFLGPTKLSDYLHFTAGKLHFNLSAAPNFSSRLKEAGITDLAAYEEKNRLRFK